MSTREVAVRLSANVSSYLAAMDKARVSTKALGDEGTKLGGSLGGSLQRLGPAMQNVGGLMSTRVTLPLVAAGGAAVKMSLDFEGAFTKMQSLAGVSASEVDGLKESVLRLAGQTAKSPTELASALYFLRSSGLDAGEAMDALDASARASAAGLGNTATIADAVSSAMNAYAGAGLSAAEATDVLVATARAGKAEPEQLAGALGRVLPIASELGVTFKDVGGAIASLSLTGNDASTSATLLENVLRKLLMPSQQGAEALEKVGMSTDTIRQSIAENGLLATLENLRSSLGDAGFNKFLEDAQAVQGALSLTGQNAEGVATTFASVADSVGATNQAFATASQSDGFKMSQAWSDLQSTLIQAGDIIVPIVTDVAGVVTHLLSVFTELPSPVQKVVLGFLAIVAGMGPMLKIGGALANNIGLIGKALGALKTVMLGHPILAFAAVVLGVATAVGLFDQSAEKAAARVRDLRDAITEAGSVMGGLTQYITGILGDSDRFATAVAKSGVSVGELAAAVQAGGATWSDMRDRLLDAGKAAGLSETDLFKLNAELRQLSTDAPKAAASAATLEDALNNGKGVGDAKDTIEALGAAHRDAAEATDEDAAAAAALDERHKELNDTQRAARLARFALTQQQEAGKRAEEEEAQAAEEAAKAADRFKLATVGLNDELRTMASALDKLIGRNLSMEQADQALYEGTVAITEAFAKNGKTLNIATAAGRENRDTVAEQVENITNHAAALIDMGASQAEATNAVNLGREALIQQVAELIGSREAAEAYVNQLGLTPENIATSVELANAEAMKAEINDIIERLGPIDDPREAEVQALLDDGAGSSYARALELLHAMEAERKAKVTVTADTSAAQRSISTLLGQLRQITRGANQDVGLLPGGASGMVIPGSVGQPFPMVAHGGEILVPTGAADQKRLLADPSVRERLVAALGAGSPDLMFGGGMVDDGPVSLPRRVGEEWPSSPAAGSTASRVILHTSTPATSPAALAPATATVAPPSGPTAAQLKRRQFERGELGADAYLADLEARRSGLEKFSDAEDEVWREIQSVRDQVQRDAERRAEEEKRRDEEKAAQKKKDEDDAAKLAQDEIDREDTKQKFLYDSGQITLQQYQEYLAGRRGSYDEFSAEWIRLTREMMALQKEADDAAKAAADADTQRERDRLKALFDQAAAQRALADAIDEQNAASAEMDAAALNAWNVGADRNSSAEDKATAMVAYQDSQRKAALTAIHRAEAEADAAGLADGTIARASAIRTRLTADRNHSAGIGNDVLAGVIDRYLMGLPAFAGGGRVGGVLGSPQPILAHGGEIVFPTSDADRKRLLTDPTVVGPLTSALKQAAGSDDRGLERMLAGVQSFAVGGHMPAKVGGHLVRVAEAGQGEHMVPDSDMRTIGKYVNLTPVGATAGGGNTTVLHLTVNAGMGTNPDQVGRQIVKHLTDWERRNGRQIYRSN